MFRTLGQLAVCAIIITLTTSADADESRRALVLSSDFGTAERFVASMKGVALSVDPGVGTDRKSVVVKTGSGHYVVTPDNGSLTLVADKQGIREIRQIDEAINRRPGSESSHTFHGRDVYAFTGARLAAAVIRFEQVGPLLEPKIVMLRYQQPKRLDDGGVVGSITHIEMPFGNIVTNIPESLVDTLGLSPQDNAAVFVELSHAGRPVFQQRIPYAQSFGYVDPGAPLLYSDSLQTIGLAVNSGNFAQQYKVQAGADWTIRLTQ